MSKLLVSGQPFAASATPEISLSGADLAHLFWGLNENDQAAFFNTLGATADPDGALGGQLALVSANPLLDMQGKEAWYTISAFCPVVF